MIATYYASDNLINMLEWFAVVMLENHVDLHLVAVISAEKAGSLICSKSEMRYPAVKNPI